VDIVVVVLVVVVGFGLRMTNFNSSPRVTPKIAKMIKEMQMIIMQRRVGRLCRFLSVVVPAEYQRLSSILFSQ
jgi:hypothetical protein